MIEKCKHCEKDIKDLKPTQKGQHIANCILNPNFKFTAEKRAKTKLNTQRIKNPLIKLKLNCLNCNKEFEVEVVESYYKRGRYTKCCCKECAHKYSYSFVNNGEIKIKKCKKCDKETEVNILSSDNIYCDDCRINTRKTDTLEKAKEVRKRKIKNVKNNKYVCKYCGEEVCNKPDVCRKFTHKNVYEKYLGFNSNKKGTSEFYNEFDRIVNKLKKDYFDTELSLPEIGKKYKMNYQTVHMVFKSLGIISRSCIEGSELSIKNGKPYKSCYKHGYHTTWKNEQVHYRSSYEKEYYTILDENKINYQVEILKISYYDTQKKKIRIAIPDIYIKDKNEIVEIKSKWTLDEINMQDKIIAYKKLGYNVKLMIGEGKKNFFKNSKEIIY